MCCVVRWQHGQRGKARAIVRAMAIRTDVTAQFLPLHLSGERRLVAWRLKFTVIFGFLNRTGFAGGSNP